MVHEMTHYLSVRAYDGEPEFGVKWVGGLPNPMIKTNGVLTKIQSHVCHILPFFPTVLVFFVLHLGVMGNTELLVVTLFSFVFSAAISSVDFYSVIQVELNGGERIK